MKHDEGQAQINTLFKKVGQRSQHVLGCNPAPAHPFQEGVLSRKHHPNQKWNSTWRLSGLEYVTEYWTLAPGKGSLYWEGGKKGLEKCSCLSYEAVTNDQHGCCYRGLINLPRCEEVFRGISKLPFAQHPPNCFSICSCVFENSEFFGQSGCRAVQFQLSLAAGDNLLRQLLPSHQLLLCSYLSFL